MKNSTVIAAMLSVALAVSIATSLPATEPGVVIGNVRVQPLSDTLVRLEEKGKRGFEDRDTFVVVERNWPFPEFRPISRGNDTALIGSGYEVIVPDRGVSLAGVRILSAAGQAIYECNGRPPDASPLPSPGEMPAVWVMADSPRIVPPEWGATPPPSPTTDPRSGWCVDNDAPDIYIFIPGKGGYAQLRSDFLKLTGPAPMPPLFTFGLMDSRYHPYTGESTLRIIDTYREKQIPLDLFVVDTDWRVGASHGYGVNKKLFPDMKQFLSDAHDRNVKLMFNDHPEPIRDSALDPEELQYRGRCCKPLTEKRG